MPSRKFFQYELNWLKKYGHNLDNLDRIGETPVEYVTGNAQFLDFIFIVSRDTLIPRIETEEIVPLALEFLSTISTDHFDIADIGTGSGCIGISLASKLLENKKHDFDLFLSDISPNALDIAKQNAQNILGLNAPKVHFLNSSLLEKYPTDRKFDLVIANLPYIPSERIKTLDSSVKDFEPITALDGGKDGTNIINSLLQSVSPFLKDNFLIILEVDYVHTVDMFSLPPNTNVSLKTDSLNRPRFLLITPKH